MLGVRRRCVRERASCDGGVALLSRAGGATVATMIDSCHQHQVEPLKAQTPSKHQVTWIRFRRCTRAQLSKRQERPRCLSEGEEGRHLTIDFPQWRGGWREWNGGAQGRRRGGACQLKRGRPFVDPRPVLLAIPGNSRREHGLNVASATPPSRTFPHTTSQTSQVQASFALALAHQQSTHAQLRQAPKTRTDKKDVHRLVFVLAVLNSRR